LSSPTSTRLPAAQRRRLIEDAASEVFAKRGYASASLEEIARRAGVTKPVIYRHFASKKELHLALLRRHLAELLALQRDELLPRIAGQGLTADELRSWISFAVDVWFAYVEEHPFAWRMLFRDTTGDPEIQEFHRQMQHQARATVRALIEAAEGLDVPPRLRDAMAELVRSAVVGTALWWAENPELPRVEVVRMVASTIGQGIAPAVESAG
jgi:AcrR family transcriptional regulator